MKSRYLLLSALVLVVYALHQDIWNWHRSQPLLFGMFPPGLWYHLGYSVVAAVTMVLLVKFAWPVHLEDEEDKS
jgi:hypothetical protein